MAQVNIRLHQANTISRTGGTLQTPKSQPKSAKTLANPSSSTLSGIANAAAGSDVWFVAPSGGDVWIKVGTGTPVATVGGDDCQLVFDGSVWDGGVTEDDETIAVINAT